MRKSFAERISCRGVHKKIVLMPKEGRFYDANRTRLIREAPRLRTFIRPWRDEVTIGLRKSLKKNEARSQLMSAVN